MALPHAKLGVSLFRHPCRKPLSPERGYMLGLPPLVPVGGYAPQSHFMVDLINYLMSQDP